MPYLGNQHIVGDSIHNFKVLDDISSYTETFDGSASSVVSTSDETIKVINHRFIQGQRVTYNNGGGGNIGGLSSGTAYYVTYDSANTIKLATTLVDANNNTNINLTSVGSGTAHTLTAAFDGVNKKFRITHGGGTRARFSQASQLRIAINNVIQKANNDYLNFSEGYAIEVRSIIVFQTAPTVNDVFFGSLLGETLGTFDISDHKIDNHTGDGSTVNFSLSRNVPNVQSLLVTLDGVLQHASDATTSRAYSLLADNIIRFTAAPASGVQIQIRHLGFAGAATGEVSGFYGRTGNVGLSANDHITTGDITSRNINSSGIITASSFIGDGSGLIGVASTDNIVTGTAATFNTYPVDINAGMTVAGVSTFGAITATSFGAINATTGTFSGNVTIGGTLTYEDVTNIDSVGVITAKGADVNGDLDVDGHTNLDNVSVAGVTTHNEDVWFKGATSNRDAYWDKSANTLYFKDNARIVLGNSSDFRMYHTPNSGAYGGSNILGANGHPIQLMTSMNGAGENGIIINPNSGVKLYYDNSIKLETSQKGIKVGTGVTIETNGQATFVGVVTFGSGSTTIDDNVVNVGTALTLGHTQGLQFHTQNLHAQGFEVNQINASGIVTASSFSGSVAASNLTGTIPTARLGSGTANSSTFLRGDSTFAVVDTDLVADTSPQLGGNLDAGSHDIIFDDNSKLKLGNDNDLQIYHSGAASIVANHGTGDLYLQDDGNVIIGKITNAEVGIKVIGDGAVELYHDNAKKFETTSSGVTVTGGLTADNVGVGDNEYIRAGNSSDIQFYHDANGSIHGTSAVSYIKCQGVHDNILDIFTASATGKIRLKSNNLTETMLVANGNGAVELYHNNVKKFETSSVGANVSGNFNVNDGQLTITHSVPALNLTDNSDPNGNDFAIQVNTNQFKIVDTTNSSRMGFQFGSDGNTALGGNVTISGSIFLGTHLDMGDNDLIKLGDSDDLEIFHDGSNSYIKDTGTGSLLIRGSAVSIQSTSGEAMIEGVANGAVTIKHDNSARLTTTSTGVTLDGTGALKFPVGTTAQRPSASQGMVRYNSTTNQLEVYDGSEWANVNSQPFEATGGSTSTSSRSGYKVHTFTSPGTFTVSGDVTNKTIEVLVIGGGGAGGEGGGGAGALRFTNNFTASPGNYSVSIGGGGSGNQSYGNNGSSSSFGNITAPGGGGGGGSSRGNGNPGGSGGGTRRDNGGSRGNGASSGGSNNSNSPSSGWGNRGGSGNIGNWCGGGGGGGAGGVGGQGNGGSPNGERGGPGGSGLAYSINGSSVERAGGGGGGTEGAGNPSGPGRGGNTSGGGGRGGVSNQVPGGFGASAGTANTGGGGGGNASTGYSGGNHSGGSGIVIVAYTT